MSSSTLTVTIARTIAAIGRLPSVLTVLGTRIETRAQNRSHLLGVTVGKLTNIVLTSVSAALIYGYCVVCIAGRAARAWWRVFKQPTVRQSVRALHRETQSVRRQRSHPGERGPVSTPSDPPRTHNQSSNRDQQRAGATTSDQGQTTGQSGAS